MSSGTINEIMEKQNYPVHKHSFITQVNKYQDLANGYIRFCHSEVQHDAVEPLGSDTFHRTKELLFNWPYP